MAIVAIGGRLQEQVREVALGEERVVEEPERHHDDPETDDQGQRSELSVLHPLPPLVHVRGQRLIRSLLALRRARGRDCALCHFAVVSGPAMPGTGAMRAGRDGVDDLLLGRLRPLEERDALPEPQHGDAVRHLEDVVEVVRDDDDAEAFLGQTADEVQHLARLRHPESGCRLVEDHELRVPHDRLRHRHCLTLPSGQPRDPLADGLQRRDGEIVERRPRSLLHARLVEHADVVDALAAEEHVRDDVEVVGEREILVDDLDAEVGGVARTVDVDLRPLEERRALVERIDADDALDERRLAGPVVTDERHDLAVTHLEVDVVQGLDGPERPRYAPALDEGPVAGAVLPPSAGAGALSAPPPFPVVRAQLFS